MQILLSGNGLTKGDPEIKQQILVYNEDACIATRVLIDGIITLYKDGPLRSTHSNRPTI